MCIQKLLELLKKEGGASAQLEACNASLKQCSDQKGALEQANISLQAEVLSWQQQANGCSAKATTLQKEIDELKATANLMTEGPSTPDPATWKWLPQGFINEVMSRQLGVKYDQCPAKHFTESDYLVTTMMEMKRFIDYYAMFWMPHIKYITQEFKKKDGNSVLIYMNDCDNYANFLQGLPAINANWACFPWGKIWAEVQGVMMMGGHAFNCVIVDDGTYNETSSAGLKAYLLEPQAAGGGPWPAARAPIQNYTMRLFEEVSGLFEIQGTIWMFEV